MKIEVLGKLSAEGNSKTGKQEAGQRPGSLVAKPGIQASAVEKARGNAALLASLMRWHLRLRPRSPKLSRARMPDRGRSADKYDIKGLSHTAMIPFLSWRNARECLIGAIGIYALCMIGGEFIKIGSTVAFPPLAIQGARPGPTSDARMAPLSRHHLRNHRGYPEHG